MQSVKSRRMSVCQERSGDRYSIWFTK